MGALPESPVDADASPYPKATGRGVLVGCCFVAWINFWISYAEYIVHASRMNISHYPVALFISYFIFAASIPLLRQLSSWLILNSADMAIILAMGMVGAMVPTSGLMGFFLGIIATPFYFATAVNRWGEFFHPHIPEWVAPRDYGQALTWFFDGPPGGDVAITMETPIGESGSMPVRGGLHRSTCLDERLAGKGERVRGAGLVDVGVGGHRSYSIWAAQGIRGLARDRGKVDRLDYHSPTAGPAGPDRSTACDRTDLSPGFDPIQTRIPIHAHEAQRRGQRALCAGRT